MAPRGDPEITRARLLEAALRAFAEHGYEGASMRRIAEIAGVAPGLAYHYFEGKEALLNALLTDSSAKLFATFSVAAAVVEPRDRVAALIRVARDDIAARPQFYRLAAGLRAQPLAVPGVVEMFGQVQGALVAQWAEWLAAAGSDQPVVDAHLAIGALTGIAQDAASIPDYPLEAVTERLIARLIGRMEET